MLKDRPERGCSSGLQAEAVEPESVRANPRGTKAANVMAVEERAARSGAVLLSFWKWNAILGTNLKDGFE